MGWKMLTNDVVKALYRSLENLEDSLLRATAFVKGSPKKMMSELHRYQMDVSVIISDAIQKLKED